MQVQFSWVRQTRDANVYVAHFPGIKRGVTFPIPKALSERLDAFVVSFPVARLVIESGQEVKEKPYDQNQSST